MKKDPHRLIKLNGLVALACYVTTYIALTQALPPGYATPLWPAAGISIAAALLYGFRVAPGIWLGSWTLNFFHGDFWTHPPEFQLKLAFMGTLIASASTLQAYCARYLTLKICGKPVQLDRLRSILLYLFFILPCACLIASTLGSLAIILVQNTPESLAGITWLTWWIGDLVGAALFSIATFCVMAEPRKLWHPRRVLLGIPTAIITCSLFFLYLKTIDWQADRMVEHIQHHSTQLELELALIKRNSDLKWMDFLEGLPQDRPYEMGEERRWLQSVQSHFPNLQSFSLQRVNQEPFWVWNTLPGPVDPFREPRKRSPTIQEVTNTSHRQHYKSNLFPIRSERLGILHTALIGTGSAGTIQILAITDLSRDIQKRLDTHSLGGFTVTFGPKASIQTDSITTQDLYVMHSSNVFQHINYSLSMPISNVLESASFEYIIIMIFSVIFTLAVLSLLLLSSGQSYHFEQLFHERTAALHVQKMITEHASKLAALGEMAGSIAHEINNPLAIIQGYSEILQTKLDRGEMDRGEFKKGLSRIEQTCRRISAIIVSLRSYARNDAADQLAPCSAREIVAETLELCREGLKDRHIEMFWDQLPDAMIVGNKAGLMQVLLNLIANARDAVARLPNRWIRIAIEDAAEDIVIRVSDSGSGIPNDLQEKIMQPFFTTKPVGKGTGLGLSISRNLMQAMGGGLDLDRMAPHTSFMIRVRKHIPTESPKTHVILTRAPELSPT